MWFNRRTSNKEKRGMAALLRLPVLRLRLLQDGDVGVSVFPEGEEVLVGDAVDAAGR